MVLLDLLHIQRAGFFKFLKSGLNEELSQLNINIENTRLEVLPFTAFVNNEFIADKSLTFAKTSNTQPKKSKARVWEKRQGVRHSFTPQFNETWSPADSSLLAPSKHGQDSFLLKSHTVNKKRNQKYLKRFSPSIILNTENYPKTKGAHLYIYPTITSISSTRGVAKNDSQDTCSSASLPFFASKPKVNSMHQYPCPSSLRNQRLVPCIDTPFASGDHPFFASHSKGDALQARVKGNAKETKNKAPLCPLPLVQGETEDKSPKAKGMSVAFAYPFTPYPVHRRCIGVRTEGAKGYGVSMYGTRSEEGVRKGTYLRFQSGEEVRKGDVSTPFGLLPTETFASPYELPLSITRKMNQEQQVEKIGDYVTKRLPNITKNACFCLVAPKYTPREAILYQKSWSCKLVVKVSLTVQGLEQSAEGNKSNHISSFSTLPYASIPVPMPSAPMPMPLRGKGHGQRGNGHRGTQSTVSLPLTSDSVFSPQGTKPFIPKINVLPKVIQSKGNTKESKISLALPLEESKILEKNLKMLEGVLPDVQPLAPLSKSDKQQNGHELFLVLGELPLMTKRGHFIINGSPRVILSQLIRTPGIYFTERDNELQADCVPEQGPWLCISKNSRPYPASQGGKGITRGNTGYAKESEGKTQKRNLPSVSKQRSEGITEGSEGNKQVYDLSSKENKNLSSYFCYTKQFSSMPFSLIYSNFRIFELHSQFTDQTLLLTKLKTLEKIRQLRELITTLLTFTWKKRTRKRLQKLYTKRCFTATQQFEKTKIIFRLKRKLILGFLGRKSFNEKLAISNCENITSISLPYGSPYPLLPSGVRVLQSKDKTSSKRCKNIFATLYPCPSYPRFPKAKDVAMPVAPLHLYPEGVRGTGHRHGTYLRFRSEEGILRGNNASPESIIEGNTLLSQDLALIIRFLDSYKIMPKDDIDDLNNQRVRTSSDQIQQQVRVGCLRFRKMFIKLVRESWGVSQTITDLLNGALREFFGSNPLSQFLDQTNSLAEITHKRRISKLGLGGIQRESATLKVRTIHSTYFGRICPIETPEGVNAGLVNSLTCLSRVNEQGQLVTPLSPLMEKQLQNQFFYYSNQDKEAVSTTDTALLKFQRLPNQFIYTKNESHFQQLEVHKVHLRVQSDLQTISLATALIPFLPYDDANRALMGSNMQRQAVPLILPERPMIRTGLESLVISESGHSKESPTEGFISYVSAQFVIIMCHALNKRALSFYP